MGGLCVITSHREHRKQVKKSASFVCIILALGCTNSQHVFRLFFFLTWNIIQTSKTDSVTSPKCLVNTSGLLTLQTPPKNWQILKGQMSKTKGIFTWPAHDLRPLAGAKQGGRYLQWRVSSTFIYKPVLGGGFPWHKLDVYSFYRWGFFNF